MSDAAATTSLPTATTGRRRRIRMGGAAAVAAIALSTVVPGAAFAHGRPNATAAPDHRPPALVRHAPVAVAPATSVAQPQFRIGAASTR